VTVNVSFVFLHLRFPHKVASLLQNSSINTVCSRFPAYLTLCLAGIFIFSHSICYKLEAGHYKYSFATVVSYHNRSAVYIKIWAACDATSSYAWNLQVYTGKPDGGAPEKNQGMRVVLDMSQGLSGHNITYDNLFTSHKLGQELLKRKLTMVGTIWKNKSELPPQILTSKNRPVKSSKFAYTADTSLVSYMPKKDKNVVLMSTLHGDGRICDQEHHKPEIIMDYNATKGGVDNMDKLVTAYSCKRRTLRWPLVIFFDMLDISAYNAFVIWMALNPEWNRGKLQKRRLFLEDLGKALVRPQIEERQRVPEPQPLQPS